MEELDPFYLLNIQADHVKAELDNMLVQKKITEDDYNMNITSLAYEYAINGFMDDCLIMLLNVRSNYFNNAAISKFKEDDIFFNKCQIMFELLAYVGKVPYDIMTTQKEAQA